jgi:hypothetical protein
MLQAMGVRHIYSLRRAGREHLTGPIPFGTPGHRSIFVRSSIDMMASEGKKVQPAKVAGSLS